MPEGRMTWWDASAGSGRIENSGGSYLAGADDVEPDAQVKNAMVSFDAERGRGMEHDRAVNVRLRRGLRNDTDQGRFGEQRS
ncbi:MAG TPA: hypothetical protein VNU01_00055 [Egibacteraceae bacterium]|nr:hypothetical protein [Egibacteraceae bacterium]